MKTQNCRYGAAHVDIKRAPELKPGDWREIRICRHGKPVTIITYNGKYFPR
jgi:hypothetical protein